MRDRSSMSRVAMSAVAIVSLLILTSGQATAATVSWTNVNGNWTEATKWTGGIPTSADDAVLLQTSAKTVTISTAAVANSIAVTNSGANVLIANGGSLTVNGSIGSASVAPTFRVTQTNSSAASVLSASGANFLQMYVYATGGGTAYWDIACPVTGITQGSLTVGGSSVGAVGEQGSVRLLTGGVLKLNRSLVLSKDADDTGTFTMAGGTLMGRNWLGTPGQALATGGGTANFYFDDGIITVSDNTYFTAAVDLQLAGTGTHTLKSTDGSIIIESVIKDKVVGEAGALQIDTSGTLGTGFVQFRNVNTYTGDTTVTAGILSLFSTGDIADVSKIKVANGATYSVAFDGTKSFQNHDVRSQLTGSGIEGLVASLDSGAQLAVDLSSVAMSWRAATGTDADGLTASNVLSLSMMVDGSPEVPVASYILGMEYLPSLLSGDEAMANIASSSDGGATWTLGGTNPVADYASLAAAGDYWADVANDTVYVVFDHASQFVVVSVIPEPSTVVMLAMGVIGILAYAWRKRK